MSKKKTAPKWKVGDIVFRSPYYSEPEGGDFWVIATISKDRKRVHIRNSVYGNYAMRWVSYESLVDVGFAPLGL